MKISLSELLRIAGEATDDFAISSGYVMVVKNDICTTRISPAPYSKEFKEMVALEDRFKKAFNPEVARRLVVALQDAMKALEFYGRYEKVFSGSDYQHHGNSSYRYVSDDDGQLARECLERLGDITE